MEKIINKRTSGRKGKTEVGGRKWRIRREETMGKGWKKEERRGWNQSGIKER